jgi:hypothetical protein
MTALEELSAFIGGALNTEMQGEFVIGTELLPAERDFQNAALKAQPNDVETSYIDGRRKFTKYKALYIRSGFADDAERVHNEAFLTELRDVIWRKSRRRELPRGGGRKWASVECVGSPLVVALDEGGREATYQMTLKIVYEEE